MTIEELISVFASWAVNVAARLVLTLVVLFVGFKVAKIIIFGLILRKLWHTIGRQVREAQTMTA